MKVYVLIKNDIDRKIMGIFSKEEDAKNMLTPMEINLGEYDIEEHQLIHDDIAIDALAQISGCFNIEDAKNFAYYTLVKLGIK